MKTEGWLLHVVLLGVWAEDCSGRQCDSYQESAARQCTENCAGCKVQAVVQYLDGCVFKDTNAPFAGCRGQVSTTPCSVIQEQAAHQCLLECSKMTCKEKSVVAFLGGCLRKSTGAAFPGCPAQTTTQRLHTCTAEQQNALLKCSQSCDSCDYTEYNILAKTNNACTHAALEVIQKECPQKEGVPCHKLQLDLIDECVADCVKCPISRVGTVLGATHRYSARMCTRRPGV
jgi:hypothetical protein